MANSRDEKPTPEPVREVARKLRYFHSFSRLFYLLLSLVFLSIGIALIAYAVHEAWNAITGRSDAVEDLLDAIGLVVLSLAVSDVAKYLMEEEVLRDRELSSPTEARQTLTKFMVIICIAVSLEALVFISRASKGEASDLLYPAVLLLAAVAMMVGLGVYQKMSTTTEAKTEDEEPR